MPLLPLPAYTSILSRSAAAARRQPEHFRLPPLHLAALHAPSARCRLRVWHTTPRPPLHAADTHALQTTLTYMLPCVHCALHTLPHTHCTRNHSLYTRLTCMSLLPSLLLPSLFSRTLVLLDKAVTVAILLNLPAGNTLPHFQTSSCHAAGYGTGGRPAGSLFSPVCFPFLHYLPPPNSYIIPYHTTIDYCCRMRHLPPTLLFQNRASTVLNNYCSHFGIYHDMRDGLLFASLASARCTPPALVSSPLPLHICRTCDLPPWLTLCLPICSYTCHHSPLDVPARRAPTLTVPLPPTYLPAACDNSIYPAPYHHHLFSPFSPERAGCRCLPGRTLLPLLRTDTTILVHHITPIQHLLLRGICRLTYHSPPTNAYNNVNTMTVRTRRWSACTRIKFGVLHMCLLYRCQMANIL